MCNIVNVSASELVGGEVMHTEDETLWGWASGHHKVVNLKCDLIDHLIVFELRDGPVLRYILHAEPTQQFKICIR